MTDLPMIESCALDPDGMRRQRDRYAAIGRGARVRARTSGRLEVELRRDVDIALVEETLAVERACCPFFALAYDPRRRVLAVGVDAAHEPALDAIAFSLGVS